MLRLIILLFTLSVIACNSGVSKSELINYLNDDENGLSKSQKVDNYTIKVRFHPSDLIAAREINSSDNPQEIEKIKRKLGSVWYFDIDISDNGKEIFNRLASNESKFSEIQNRVNYEMYNYINFSTTSNKNIPVLFCNALPSYGMRNSTKIVTACSSDAISSQDHLELSLQEFGLGIGEVKFKFNTKDILAIPTLIFNQSESI